MATNFRNLRWQVSDTVRLSISTWEDGDLLRSAVALLRKTGSKWSVDGLTAHELCSKDAEDLCFRDAEVGRRIVEAETGQPLPLRFYRDALLTGGR